MMNYRQMLYCAALAMLTACGTADKKIKLANFLRRHRGVIGKFN